MREIGSDSTLIAERERERERERDWTLMPEVFTHVHTHTHTHTHTPSVSPLCAGDTCGTGHRHLAGAAPHSASYVAPFLCDRLVVKQGMISSFFLGID